jgi:hypothetical protein
VREDDRVVPLLQVGDLGQHVVHRAILSSL